MPSDEDRIDVEGLNEFQRKILDLSTPMQKASASADTLRETMEKLGADIYPWQEQLLGKILREGEHRGPTAREAAETRENGPRVLIVAKSYEHYQHALHQISVQFREQNLPMHRRPDYIGDSTRLRGARYDVVFLCENWQAGFSHEDRFEIMHALQYMKMSWGTSVYEVDTNFRSVSDELDDMTDAMQYAWKAFQRNPPDDDEVCCICHEDIGGGYPPEAYERRQAPYTYVDDLQGWAHDVCAKEYFQPKHFVSDLKPSRTEQLP